LIFSLMKGLVREIFSLLAFVGGYLIAVKYKDAFAQSLIKTIPSESIANLIAFVSIYIVSAIIISLIGKIIKSIIWSGTDLSIFDRLLGGVVGLVKGITILIAVTFPLQFFPEVTKKITADSYTAPYLDKILKFINQNPTSLNIGTKFSDFNIEGAKEKFDEMRDFKMLNKTYNKLKEKLPGSDKPLEEYSPGDRKKLKDILKSFDNHQ
jgi:uncharacterized membrane protein required for colicin V production